MYASNEFSDQGFWNKMATAIGAANRRVLKQALMMYYALGEAETPAWAKATIVGALGYFIMPLDAVPDIIPVAGYSDDLAVLLAAAATVSAHITEAIERRAEAVLTAKFRKA